MKTYILYHKNCTDGFGAAFAAWKKFYDKAEYIAISHIDPIPTFEEHSEIYVVDFCFPKSVLEQLTKNHRIVTLDHHVSASEAIKSSSDYVYDLHRSGAKIAWDYFHPGTECKIIDYISDKDLGLYKLFKSREIIAAIESYPRDFKIWGNFSIDQLISEGHSILRTKNIEVGYALDKVVFEKIAGHKTPTVNSSIFMNEIAELLIEKFPKSKMVAVYYEFEKDGEKYRKYSLRSKKIDVNEIAAKFNGGGHVSASAYLIKVDDEKKGSKK